jgi:hypothetical protein
LRTRMVIRTIITATPRITPRRDIKALHLI